MGLTAEDLKSRYLYNTNYVIWDNIGLEQQDRNIPAYQLMADVMNRWIFIPEHCSIIISRDRIPRITCQT